jgi:hypothetical protein
VNHIFPLLGSLLLLGCAQKPEMLVVKPFLLRDQQDGGAEDPMVLMEKQRHLYGALSMAERRERLGQYYSIHWNDADGVGKGPVKLVFRYQQGATASQVNEKVHYEPASAANGRVEFSVIGEDYFKNGKVLAWQASLERGGKVVGTRQSYLWQ